VSAAILAFSLVLLVLNLAVLNTGSFLVYAVIGLIVAAYAASGLLIAGRRPQNPIGWIFCTVGLALSLVALGEQYAVRGLVTAPGSLPGIRYVVWLGDWTLNLSIAPLLFVFLLFPNGRVLSRRWRPVAWVGVAVLILGVAGWALHPHLMSGITNTLIDRRLQLHNPFGLTRFKSALGVVLGLTGAAGVIVAVLCVVAMVIRLRRSHGEERQQVRWLAYVGLADVVLFVGLIFSGIFAANSLANNILFAVLFISIFLGIPAASAIAILKYRLYDLEIVVKKTVVFGALVVFFTLVYAAVVVGIGAAIGKRSNSVLTFAAAAIVAVAFQPVRTRARRFADRMVYGKRASPYEVLSDFADRVSNVYSTDDVLPRMAQIVAAGTGATRAEVWLRVGPEIRLSAEWPADGEPRDHRLALTDGDLPQVPGSTRTFPVRHQGELLGAISVDVPASDPLTPSQEKLVQDLASQAGLVLRNVRLIEELKASRQRLVAAQDQERRRIERNIHDGAQQQLVALAVKLNLAGALIGRDEVKQREMIDQLKSETQDALENLRDLARGIYPPLLSDKGLTAALDAQARKSPIPVEVEADGIARYPAEVESALYFCVLEALQNVAKYARATKAHVRLVASNGEVGFEVSDDGVGFDPATTPPGSGLQNMADRLAALGGSIQIDSHPGGGTSVIGRVSIDRSERGSVRSGIDDEGG
jgi:signal transduction histidine kinase